MPSFGCDSDILCWYTLSEGKPEGERLHGLLGFVSKPGSPAE